MKKRSLKFAIAACLIGLAVGLRGPDGNMAPWQDTALTIVATVCGALIIAFAALFLMICRDAQHDIELSAERDAAETVYETRGIPPHDPPAADPGFAKTETSPTDDVDLQSLYLSGLQRGRSLVEHAHRLRPAHEVCGTAE